MPKEEQVEEQKPVDAAPNEGEPNQDILPVDVPEEKEDNKKIEEEFKQKQHEMEEKLRMASEEKQLLEKRLKDNQEYISRTRNAERDQAKKEQPQKTINDYFSEIDGMIDKQFEDDPKQGLKSVVKKIVSDIVFDKNLEREELQKQIADAEKKAFQRAVSLDPDKAQLLRDVESLDQDRPDLAYLSFEHKVEWLKNNKQLNRETQRDTSAKTARSRDMAMDNFNRSRTRADELPAWAKDPDIQSRAAEHFKSQREMVDYTNAAKAREMALRSRPKYTE
ncbi:MAG: hypothetical protein PHW65_00080 [Dehalococcoidales bacterium]|nr:hypothetical protein [Dehalococcoidales bacterium]